jgi:hypothetical protein
MKKNLQLFRYTEEKNIFFVYKDQGGGPDVRCKVQDQGGGPDVRCIVQDQGGGSVKLG